MKKYLKITYTNKKNIEYIKTDFIVKIEKIPAHEYMQVIRLDNDFVPNIIKNDIRLQIITLDKEFKNYLLSNIKIEEVDEIDLEDLLNMEE